MTVRTALAIAGFAKRTVSNDTTTSLAAARLEGELISLRSQRDHLESEGERLRLEALALIEEQRKMENPEDGGPIVANLHDPIVNGRVETTLGNLSHLRTTLDSVDERIDILREREDAEQQALDSDTEEKERVDRLFERGVVAVTRQAEARKSLLFSSTRLLQTQDTISRTLLDRMNIEYELDRRLSGRLMEIQEEAEKNELSVSMVSTQIAAVSQQLRLLGVVVPESGKEPVLKLHRGYGEDKQTLVAMIDDGLRPGDVLEVIYEPNEQ
jgi:polysaccharide export outer membrane protein